MRLTSYIKILLVALFVTCTMESCEVCRKVTITNKGNIKKQLSKENVTYVVEDAFDLKGETINIPDNCVLLFKGGRISNGVINGQNTRVSADRKTIFKNVSITGCWNNKRVFSEWLEFEEDEKKDNAQNFKNLMTLCNGDDMTHLYMQKGVFYCSVVTGGSNIKVPSNVYWHNSATICQLPTISSKYGFVLVQKSNNVTIDGGTFVGDVRHHEGKGGEWGHGIKIAGSTNVVLKNIVVKEFWGDGIDLIEGEYNNSITAGEGVCNRIVIENIKSLYNRRQGLSVEAAHNVTIRNSEFAYTGKYGLIDPGCGIDIEPWCYNERKIDNIQIINCYIHDNNSMIDLYLVPNLIYQKKVSKPQLAPFNNIYVSNCSIGKLYIQWANGVKFEKCKIEDLIHKTSCSEVVFKKTSIKQRTDRMSFFCRLKNFIYKLFK